VNTNSGKLQATTSHQQDK